VVVVEVITQLQFHQFHKEDQEEVEMADLGMELTDNLDQQVQVVAEVEVHKLLIQVVVVEMVVEE
jgi:hypothetical protein